MNDSTGSCLPWVVACRKMQCACAVMDAAEFMCLEEEAGWRSRQRKDKAKLLDD